MVAPGLAGLDTVMVLHDARRIGHPNATWGITEGNPIHDDIREIARMVGVDFAVDVTLNREQKITAVFAGDLFEEHRAACTAAKRDAMRAVEAPFDVVLTTNSGFPLDQNLYQAVKGMSAAARVVKPGGTIVCAAACADGLPSHGSYGEVLASQPSPEKLLEMINAPGYSTPDQWQVQIQAQVQIKAAVLVKTEGLTPDAIRAAHFQPIDDVGATVADALRRAGPRRRSASSPRSADDTLPRVARLKPHYALGPPKGGHHARDRAWRPALAGPSIPTLRRRAPRFVEILARDVNRFVHRDREAVERQEKLLRVPALHRHEARAPDRQRDDRHAALQCDVQYPSSARAPARTVHRARSSSNARRERVAPARSPHAALPPRRPEDQPPQPHQSKHHVHRLHMRRRVIDRGVRRRIADKDDEMRPPALVPHAEDGVLREIVAARTFHRHA